MILRRVARPLLAAVFVADGLRALRRPVAEIENLPGADEQLESLATKVPYVPADAALLVRGIGVVKIGAGVLLGLGVAPRVAATVLAVLQVPTMVANHPVWAVPADRRKEHLAGLLQDGAVLGGLLLAASDTEGKPSIAWRVNAASTRGAKATKKATRKAGSKARRTVEHKVGEVERSVSRAESKVEKELRKRARALEKSVDAATSQVAAGVEGTVHKVRKDVRAAVGS